jgi:hypothetical protein
VISTEVEDPFESRVLHFLATVQEKKRGVRDERKQNKKTSFSERKETTGINAKERKNKESVFKFCVRTKRLKRVLK